MEYEIGESYRIEERNHPAYIMRVQEIVDDGIRGLYYLVDDEGKESQMGWTPLRFILKVEKIS